jgi:hypothetical protein
MCESCHNDCESCSGPSSFQCSACRVGQNKLLIKNSYCGLTCPLGTVDDGLGICQDCFNTCETCKGTSN